MKTVDADPRFDSITLGNLKIDRMGPGDVVEAKFAYVNSKNRQTFGFVTLSQPQMFSDRTRDLLSKLAESLEEDAAVVLFKTTKEEKKEGLHEPEPTGLADEPEDDRQL